MYICMYIYIYGWQAFMQAKIIQAGQPLGSGSKFFGLESPIFHQDLKTKSCGWTAPCGHVVGSGNHSQTCSFSHVWKEEKN